MKWLDYRIIKKSGMFDPRYYLREYPDVRKADIDPLWHFIKLGWKEGRNPAPVFHTQFYLESNPDVLQKDINPLVHYIKYGKKEGRQPSENNGNFAVTVQPEGGEIGGRTQATNLNVNDTADKVKRLLKLALDGLYYLRVNGVTAFIKKARGRLVGYKPPVYPSGDKRIMDDTNDPFVMVYKESLLTSTIDNQPEYVDFVERKTLVNPPEVKLIAFYLPQFHPFPENDAWWGRGFTEWTNVSKAVPQFIGHYQPRLPGELGFYDLRVPEVQRRQVELAKNYGIYGFCFHFYWFNGKRLMDQPLNQFMNNPELDFPFCVCWANENWTRKWDGRSSDILISQEHSFAYDKLIIHDLVKLFANPRYIRIDGRPLLIIYRGDIFHDARATLEYWRNYSNQCGTRSPFIVLAQTFGYNDPRKDGFDAAVEFPPHNGAIIPEITKDQSYLNPAYLGKIFRYTDMVRTSIQRIKEEPYRRFNTVSPGWDNDSRRPGYGLTYVGSTPELYATWLNAACRFAVSHFPESERFVFINAWNEWAEAAYIEPDRKYGYAYLQATTDVLDNLANKEYRLTQTKEITTGQSITHSDISQKVESIRKEYPWYSTIREAVNRHDQPEIDNLILTIDSILAPNDVPSTATPLVSIIIPAHNHFEETLNCLKSLGSAHDQMHFEVIVIDDCSSDETGILLSNCKNLRYIRNETNIGFIKSCNKAANFANGHYLVFLNNDTIVLPGWLDTLVDTFNNHSGTGLVGSMLIYPDGRLQEAGGVLWMDANGNNFGRDDDPDKPQYNYLREADYCSGASICVPKQIWDELGGFDELFTPAYYEDADLAFRIRKNGYQVLYQPFSRVIHLEGVTSGTSTATGIKHYQEVNREKFYARWKDILLDHGDNHQPSIIYRNHLRRRHVLAIDVCTPKPDHDAGSVNTYQYLLTLRKLGYEVSFISVVDAELVDRYVEDLQRKGVECVYQPYLRSIEEYIKQNGKYFDLVLLFRAPYGGRYFDLVKKYAPQAKVVFHTVDLHFLREKRESELTGKGIKIHENLLQNEEISLMKKADVSIVVSDFEQTLLSELKEKVNTRVIPLVCEIPGRAQGFEGRKNIMYLGGYLHRPNVDAVIHFVKDIWPLITKALPECEFLIVGSNVPKELEALASDKVKVIGFVPDLTQLFTECKLTIAPIRFGAGVKGKVITSLSYGVPCVVSSIAVEGTGLTNGQNILVADDPAEFAAAVTRLYTDSSLWDKISTDGLEYVTRNYSIDNLHQHLVRLISEINLTPEEIIKN